MRTSAEGKPLKGTPRQLKTKGSHNPLLTRSTLLPRGRVIGSFESLKGGPGALFPPGTHPEPPGLLCVSCFQILFLNPLSLPPPRPLTLQELACSRGRLLFNCLYTRARSSTVHPGRITKNSTSTGEKTRGNLTIIARSEWKFCYNFRVPLRGLVLLQAEF